MSVGINLINIMFSKREAEIDYFRRHPAEVQWAQLRLLMNQAEHTVFGKSYNFATIKNAETFAQRVEVSDYNAFKGYIERTREGENGVIWPTEIKWYAKSSGTTEDVSKFIPVSDESLRDSHMQGPRDILGVYAGLYPHSKLFEGKILTLGGSHQLDKMSSVAHAGDLSAIMIENVPSWAAWKRLPSHETALVSNFDEKIMRICQETVGKNVTGFAGACSWNLVMLNRILEYTGKSNILEVWPNLELFMHGGMSFEPYREQFKKLIPTDKMNYIESYNASEGFFALQDDMNSRDMLLMLDYGIFYEFLPLEHLGDTSKTVPLEGVKLGGKYAIIITTSAGLWRYMIGDTVEFTSVNPYKIRITGRTKQFMNAFGEEVMVENADAAIMQACRETGAQISDYTAAPIYMTTSEKGGHEWLVEFVAEPDNMTKFVEILDAHLQSINSDYAAKRLNINTPVVRALPKETFYKWMKERGKLGGQNKVPRLSNDRKYVDQLLEFFSIEQK